MRRVLKSKRTLRKQKENHLPKSAVLAEEKHHELEAFQAETQLKQANSMQQSRGNDYEDRTGNGGREFRVGQPRDAERRKRGERNLAGKLARAFKLQSLRLCRAGAARQRKERASWPAAAGWLTEGTRVRAINSRARERKGTGGAWQRRRFYAGIDGNSDLANHKLRSDLQILLLRRDWPPKFADWTHKHQMQP